jgi:L-iditol 2-dehydrogenase
MGVKPGDTVAINGVGFAGNIMLQAAIRAGASMVVAIDPSEKKLDIAKNLGARYTVNPREENAVDTVNEITDDEGVDVAVDAVGGTGIGIVQALGMVAHNGLLDLYGDNYAPIRDFCFHRIHEDAIEVRTLSPVHYTWLRSVENMREAYRAIQRGVFDLDIILENSERHRLDNIAEVFEKEAEALDEQSSLKTLILP